VLGVTTMDVNAPSSATCYAATYNSFNPATGLNVGMLPVTYDVNNWNNFIKTGQAPDGSTSIDSRGNPQLQVYPSLKDTGNFGLISLNDSHVGASTVTNWINNGMAPSDVQALIDNNLIPLSNHPANTWDWNGENGFKAKNVMDMNARVGTTFLLPLFQPVNSGTPNPSTYQAGTGNGSHYFYDVVQFVGVTIMPVSDRNRLIVVQPAAYIDPSAVFNAPTVVPMGTSSSFSTTFTAAKLSS
jgi:hypothetical protein